MSLLSSADTPLVDRYHELYLKEVKRLFDTYKGRVPNYAKKELIIETTG